MAKPDEEKNMNSLVVIRGGGDLASGVAHRLFVSGFRVIILELFEPRMIRRTVSFAEAVYQGSWTIENVRAQYVRRLSTVLLKRQSFPYIPVLADPDGSSLVRLKPDILVDARMAKRNLGTRRGEAPLVIALGPGFTAGDDVDAIVETKRGHTLGRVIWEGAALPNTGIPGEVGGFTAERLLLAPGGGIFHPRKSIGEPVLSGEVVAEVGGTPLPASIGGIVRGMLKEGLSVRPGEKVGDIDPREDTQVDIISDKARSIGGGVLEAILSWKAGRGLIKKERGDSVR